MNDTGLTLILRRRQEIAGEIDRLRAEDDDLAAAERAMSRLGQTVSERPSKTRQTRAASSAGSQMRERARAVADEKGGRARRAWRRRSQETQLSQRDLVLGALGASPEVWLDTKKLLAEIDRQFGHKLPVASIRPLLTHLKLEGWIVRDKRTIALAARVASSGRRVSRS